MHYELHKRVSRALNYRAMHKSLYDGVYLVFGILVFEIFRVIILLPANSYFARKARTSTRKFPTIADNWMYIILVIIIILVVACERSLIFELLHVERKKGGWFVLFSARPLRVLVTHVFWVSMFDDHDITLVFFSIFIIHAP